VEGRSNVQAQDFAVIDYVATVEGKPFPGDKGQGVTVEVTAGELTRGNIEALAGSEIGETKAVSYTFPADYAKAWGEIMTQIATYPHVDEEPPLKPYARS
jgi:trigger factor